MLVEFCDGNTNFTLEQTAEALCLCSDLCEDIGAAKDTLEKMMSAGRRYKYFESVLGLGISLLLGGKVAETW